VLIERAPEPQQVAEAAPTGHPDWRPETAAPGQLLVSASCQSLAGTMDDVADQLGAEPRSLSEELFGRAVELKIFVSSKMAGGAFVAERLSCAATIDRTGYARAWYWERDANAGPYCSEKVCVGHAAMSDGLILILGDQLTDITRKEYEVARRRHIPTFVFIDQRAKPDAETQAFIETVRNGRRRSVTKDFANLAELESHVQTALMQCVSGSWRRASYLDWSQNNARGSV
jgi:hypothetical protein